MNIFKSRKFRLAVVGVLQTVILHYLNVPREIWEAVNVLISVVIVGIAVEDAGEKSARN